MQACDNNPAEWRDRVGLFTPETPLANGAGLDRFGAKPDLAAARRAIWFGAPDLAAERALCGQMQMAVLDHAPHMHLDRILQATCFRVRHAG